MLANSATTVNGQTCTLGSTCTIPFQTNGSGNTSQAGINLKPSTVNAVGLTLTPTNPGTNQETFEITGASYTGNSATATKSTNLASGAVGSVPYQSAANTTAFVSSPTINSHTFVLSWQPLGSAIAPTAVDASTLTVSAAATATALAATPAQCGTNVPSTGIQANGTANCTATPNIGAATGTSLVLTGTLDGKAPVTLFTTSTVTMGSAYSTGYYFNVNSIQSTAVTATLPVAVAGEQYCITNDIASGTSETGAITVQTSGSGQYIHAAPQLTSSGGYAISNGAAGDSGCFVGINANDWVLFGQGTTTWTLH